MLSTNDGLEREKVNRKQQMLDRLQQSGNWVPLVGGLKAGDAVRVGQSFSTDDSGTSVVLNKDILGEV